jgi:alpha-beta hydrolase superfamily lysophospholipase
MASSTPRDPAKKKTNVRLSTIRGALRGLTAVSPALASNAAGALFRMAPRHRTSEEEQRALASARHARLTTAAGDSISTWEWGDGPRVLLVHGWGSRGARLTTFLAPLLDAGFSVVTFDAPGHGASAGRLSSAPQFVRTIEAVAADYGPFQAAIAHSMGG